MATNLHLVPDNFVWKIESITPTNTLARTIYKEIDPYADELPITTGGLRRFRVQWNDSDALIGATDISRREAWHKMRVQIYYPVCLRYQDLRRMVLQDRHDRIKLLRNPDSWKGYDASHTTTDIGIMARFFDGDELDTNEENVWIFTEQYKVLIEENE